MADVLVTGATGFIGQQLVALLEERGHSPVILDRQPGPESRAATMFPDHPHLPAHLLNGEDPPRRFDAIVHLAGLAEVAGRADRRTLMQANAALTGQLVDFAIGCDARIFIHMSSIMAVSANKADGPIDDAVAPAPDSDYGRSKLAAEAHVDRFSRSGRLGISLRPPMVIGHAAKGNWRAMRKIAALPVPLPFGAIANRRSVVGVRTLCRAIVHVIEGDFDASRSGRFALANQPPASVRDMLAWLREGAGRPAWLFAVPVPLIELALGLAGRGRMAASLTGDLEVDPRRFNTVFRFDPPETTRAAIMESAAQPRQPAPAGRSSATAPGRRDSRLRVVLDQAVAIAMLIVLLPVLLAIGLAIRLDSAGPALFVQTRVGRNERPFRLYKFRTMKRDTPEAATHQVAVSAVTRIGAALRRTKLDELPQLVNVLRGQMGFVGPRPCLPSQIELIEHRRRRGVYAVRPGITGLAQVRGIDMSRPETLAEVDAQYVADRSLSGDVALILHTVLGAGRGDRTDGTPGRKKGPRSKRSAGS